jgi:formate dehydrogenase subunit delta
MSHNESAELRMVNDIVLNLNYLPADQVVTAVADHVKRFWDPRMKRRLVDLVAAGSGDLDPVVVAAAQLLP